jgi:hypothetical protein
MLTVRASTLSHFEGLAERLGSHGDMRTHIVMSTQYAGRPIQPIANDRQVTQAVGWTTPLTGPPLGRCMGAHSRPSHAAHPRSTIVRHAERSLIGITSR